MLRTEPAGFFIKKTSRTAVLMFAVFCLSLSTKAQTPDTAPKGKTMANHATGTFEVKLAPQNDGKPEDSPIGRMLIDKQIHGDLEATSKGTMLASGTGARGSSGGYVALEIVTGTLKGHTGTFVLEHSATMNRGVPQLSITVIPDSGTGQLTGLAGKMNINIADGKHSYDFEYTLPDTP